MKSEVEREYKLAVPEDFQLPALEVLAGDLAADPLPPHTLDATYYDTTGLRLARWGLTLRHRTGSATPWTVKLPEGDDGPALVRRELGFEGEKGIVPAEASDLVAAYTRAEPLVPVARLVTVRSGMRLLDADGERMLEVVHDKVAVHQGRRVSARFAEVEVEVGNANTKVLKPLLRRLAESGARPNGSTPKVMVALREVGDLSPELPAVKLTRNADWAALLGSVLTTATTRMIRHDPGVRIGDDPEDVHQARVGMRRLRSDLRTFAHVLDEEWAARAGKELRWMAGHLGAVRDADVLLDRLRADAETLPTRDAVAVGALLRRLASERERARSTLLAEMRSERYLLMLSDLVAAAQNPPVRAGTSGRASKGLPGVVAGSYRKLSRAAAKLGPDPQDEALHRVRILAKRCRYAAEATVPLLGGRAKDLARDVARVQEALGEHQDGAVTEAWLREAALEDHQLGLVAGELIAVQRERAERSRATWAAAWKVASAKRHRQWLL